jgi:hypothetical protein
VDKEEEIPKTNPAEIEKLIEQIRGPNLDPGVKEKIAGNSIIGGIVRYFAKRLLFDFGLPQLQLRSKTTHLGASPAMSREPLYRHNATGQK